MATSLTIRDEAERDIAKAFEWYRRDSQALADRFLAAVEDALARIVESPTIGAVVTENVLRHPLRKFPYGIFYRAEPERVVVLAVFHGRRHPRGWKRRIR